MAAREPGTTAATAATLGVVLVLVIGGIAAFALTQRSTTSDRPAATAPTDSTTSASSSGRPAPGGSGTHATSNPPEGPGSPTGETCVRPPRRQSIDVLTYNIHATVGPDGRVHLANLVQEIERWQPDVVLLQEVDRFQARTGGVDTPAVLAGRLGWSWTFGGNLQRGAGRYGNAILSRFPIVESRQFLLPRLPGTEQRGLLHAVLDVHGLRMSVYGTHLEVRSPAARIAQARTIVARLRADPLPIILGGDLNAHSTSPALSVLGTRLHDTWLEVGSGLGRSVPRARIDYLMHADGDAGTRVTARRALVLQSSFSDHNPVWASYRLDSLGAQVCVPAFPGQ